MALIARFLCLLLPFLSVAGATTPNIIFFLIDDMGWNDIGYHSTDIKTPILDKLAEDGLKLENYYTQPLCTPSRSCLMSGRYAIYTGLQHQIIQHQAPNGLPLDFTTIAEKMKEAGYDTHMIGKWHLGFYKDDYLPHNRGFDTFLGYMGGGEDHYTHSVQYNGIQYVDFRDENGPIFDKNGTYSGDIFTEKAVDLITDHDTSKPMFMYLAYQNVHTPLQVPDRYLDGLDGITDSNRKTYAGMVAAVEDGVDQVTQALKDKGIWDNSVVIFASDNGGSPSGGANNLPLRGQKGTLWEGGIRAPAFVTGGAFKGRGVSHELMHITDWYPTLVGLANGKVDQSSTLDGFDQWETLNAGAPSKRHIILHNIDPLTTQGDASYSDTFDTTIAAALRMGDMKLITGQPGMDHWTEIGAHSGNTEHHWGDHTGTTEHHWGDHNGQFNHHGQHTGQQTKRQVWHPDQNGDHHWHQGDHTGTHTGDHTGQHAGQHGGHFAGAQPVFNQTVWLFNITADPTEHHDISADHPETVQTMLEILAQYNSQAVDPQTEPNDPQSNPALHGNAWGPWL